jgi:hypothetical protein
MGLLSSGVDHTTENSAKDKDAKFRGHQEEAKFKFL